jgi:hypothetical protein
MGSALGAYVAGLIAAEGTFTCATQGRRLTFGVVVDLGATDAFSCELLHAFLGGTIHRYDRRLPHHDDVVRFQVRKLATLTDVVVPFMDEHLPDSYKRRQFLVWRDELLDYCAHRAEGGTAEPAGVGRAT